MSQAATARGRSDATASVIGSRSRIACRKRPTQPEGEPVCGARRRRAATLYSVGPERASTMMQASASTTRLRGGGPYLKTVPRPRHVPGSHHLGLVRELGELFVTALSARLLG